MLFWSCLKLLWGLFFVKKRNIPFSPPDISDLEIDMVAEVLKSGWITTGPKTKLFENNIAEYCGTKKAVCLGLNGPINFASYCLISFGISTFIIILSPSFFIKKCINTRCAFPIFSMQVDDFLTYVFI